MGSTGPTNVNSGPSTTTNGSGSPPPLKRRKSEPHPRLASMYSQLAGDSPTADVFLLIASERVPCHKSVLISDSPVFKKLLKEVGKEEVGVEIGVPLKFSSSGTRAFVKALYLDVDGCDLSLEVLLELLPLATNYLSHVVVRQCLEALRELLKVENSFAIWKVVSALHVNKNDDEAAAEGIKDLKNKCFNILTTSLVDSQDWDVILWEQVLKNDDIGNLTEVELFKGLVGWGDKDKTGREKEMDTLVHLVRFPLMDINAFLTYIKTTGLLTKEEMFDLLCYHNSYGVEGILPFNMKPRANRKRIAKTANEFTKLLSNAKPGDWIYLEEGTYEGDFDIKTTKVFIQGAGSDKTKIVPKIRANKIACDIQGKFVTLCDISFECSHWNISNANSNPNLVLHSNCMLRNISFNYCNVVITGNFNLLKNLNFSASLICICNSASHNYINNVVSRDSEFGISIQGSDNIVKGLDCVNVNRGVYIKGNKNMIKNVNFKFMENPSKDSNKLHAAIYIVGGCENQVNNVTCVNYTAQLLCFSVVIYNLKENGKVISCPKSNWITKCGPGCSIVFGKSNKFEDANFGSRLQLVESGHNFINCKAAQVVKQGACDGSTVVGCNFKL